MDRLTAGMGPTPTWESRRGLHLLATVPDEFGRAFHRRLARHALEGYPGLDLSFGGYKDGGARKASSAMVPPSETDGVSRVWLDRSLVAAPMPDHALGVLGRIALELAEEAAALRRGRAATPADPDELDDEEAEAWFDCRVEKLREDFERIGPAISGSGGHGRTFAARCQILEAGFEDEEAKELLREYSEDYAEPRGRRRSSTTRSRTPRRPSARSVRSGSVSGGCSSPAGDEIGPARRRASGSRRGRPAPLGMKREAGRRRRRRRHREREGPDGCGDRRGR
ncbi:hypothetical protein [Paludisphaera soli]|uniref:hypothetical protein n=1 Tax=Paludisphaera soli TaxID=2712865 RepID=UPI0013EACF68|nr:hypothetical protein [Paludisphaera soli]